MHRRGLVSYLTLAGFLVVAATGLVLYAAPQGWAANRLNWTLLGLDRHEWTNVHTVFSLLWMGFVAFHIFLNGKVLKAFVYNRGRGGWRMKKELVVVAAVMIVALIGAVNLWPPFSYVVEAGRSIQAVWTGDLPAVGGPIAGASFGPGSGQGLGRGRGGQGRGLGFDRSGSLSGGPFHSPGSLD